GARPLDLVERGLACEEVTVGLDRGDAVGDLGSLGCLPEGDLVPVGGDRRLEQRALLLERGRGGGGPAGVAPVVGPTAQLVGLRAALEAGLAIGEEAAGRDLLLEARLLVLRSRDRLLRGGGLRLVEPRDLVRRLVDPGRPRLAQLVVDRAAV